MKIGTITFHWGTNYGATLQAYALQQYLLSQGYDTEIIDYKPRKVRQYEMLWTFVRRDFKRLIKLRKFNIFRKFFLSLSKRTYYTNKQLVNLCQHYDTYITGSDQVWNVAFTDHAEGKPTLSYYLNFADKNKKRVSYATSFGTNELPDKIKSLVVSDLEQFDAISVREATGKGIIEDMGFDATITLDPTLLLKENDYNKLLVGVKTKNTYPLFSYILHDNQSFAHELKDHVYSTYFDSKQDAKYENEPISIPEWLYNIKNAKLVLTNSFHGVIFSILFHKKFIVVPVEGSDMNDRIITLLNYVGLSDRLITSVNKEAIDRLINSNTDWNKVDSDLQVYKKSSEAFLHETLEK
ncbi:MAG: polysaccharide pyruvyl transferase family protein [Clostridiales bacterium]|nr:polysaccharide pyruvyl transferase family protein [Clostridiales bacterium]